MLILELTIQESLEVLADTHLGRLDEIGKFFTGYNLAQGRRFKPLARPGPRQAELLLAAAIAKYTQSARL